MARTSSEDIKEYLNYINRVIKEGNIKIGLEGRYGYWAIDLYDLNDNIQRTLKTGMSKKEVKLFLDGLSSGIDLMSWVMST